MSQTLGELLREGRLRQRLSLLECSKRTHVALKYLEAMEADSWEQLPSESHRQGFLSLYTRFLGILPEEWKALYAARNAPPAAPVPESSQAPAAEAPAPEKTKPTLSTGRGQFVPQLHHAIAAVFAALIGLWGAYHLFSSGEVSERSMSPINRQRMEETRLVVPKRATEAIQRIRLRAHDRVWARMNNGSQLLFEGYLPAGHMKEWTPDGVVSVTLENPKQVAVFWNDQSIPLPTATPGGMVTIQLPTDLVRLSTGTVTTPTL